MGLQLHYNHIYGNVAQRMIAATLNCHAIFIHTFIASACECGYEYGFRDYTAP